MRLFSMLATAAVLALAASAGAHAEETCPVSTGAMMPKDAMTKSLQDRGYVQLRSLDTHHGCYEAKGIDKAGKRFEIELNGMTGEIVHAE